MAGFQHDVAGGSGDLIVPQIQSPNFSIASQTGWAILQNGDAYFYDITAEGSITSNTVVVSGSGEGVFVYSGTPANGNLIATITSAPGTDGFGNAYVGGITAYNGANEWASLTAGTLSLQGTSGQYQTGQLGASGSGTTFLSSGLETNTDVGAQVIAQSAQAASGPSTITLSASEVVANGAMTVTTTLTVSGTDLGALVNTIVSALSGQATSTNGLTDGTINGSSSTAGLTNGTIAGTSGSASAGTAHTHSAGSYAVNNGQHSHSAGSYAVANGTHAHDLPTV